jgi:hypothetical protein
MEPGAQQKLIDIFERLSPVDQAALVSFAEFLSSRSMPGGVPVSSHPAATASSPREEIPEPKPIPRPDQERVVAAVKRLSQTYYMLDKTRMLGVTSDLVSQHIVQGRAAEDVIDELERLFEDSYRELRQDDN